MNVNRPSPIPTRYNRVRAETTKPIQQSLERLKLPIIRVRKLNGILNALIMQIEDGGDHPEVNQLLLDALRQNLIHQVGEKDAKAVLSAIEEFERKEADYWHAVASGNAPPIQLSDDERLDDLMQEGYALIAANQQAAGCNRWLEAWELVKSMHTPKMRTANTFDAAYPTLTQFFKNWAYDLEMELGNAGLDKPIYHERRIQYTQEFLALFPDSDTDEIVNFKRAQGEALWGLGKQAEAETLYESLVKQFPDEAWGYIGWSDHYGIFGSNGEPQYEKAEAILKQALARPKLREDQYVLDRLSSLYEEWGKSEQRDEVLKQLEKVKHKDSSSKGNSKSSSPGFLSSIRLSEKQFGRNDPCWCGSGKKYKQCHWRTDQQQ
jgi:tetratricopeptide (TPR) repeat protein